MEFTMTLGILSEMDLLNWSARKLEFQSRDVTSKTETINFCSSDNQLSWERRSIPVNSWKMEKLDMSLMVNFTFWLLSLWNVSIVPYLNSNFIVSLAALGCKKGDQIYSEGQVWTEKHIRYQCSETSVIKVLGCIDEGGLFIELGRDVLIDGIVHRCYRINNTTFYHRSGGFFIFSKKWNISDSNVRGNRWRSALEQLQHLVESVICPTALSFELFVNFIKMLLVYWVNIVLNFAIVFWPSFEGREYTRIEDW